MREALEIIRVEKTEASFGERPRPFIADARRDIFEDREILARRIVFASHDAAIHLVVNVVTAIDNRAIGLAVVALGGGRTRADQKIDPAVGFSDLAPIGAAHASA